MTSNAAGLLDVGPGVAGFTGWIVAFGVLLLLAWVAWWTTRPAKRVARPREEDAAHETWSTRELFDKDHYR